MKKIAFLVFAYLLILAATCSETTTPNPDNGGTIPTEPGSNPIIDISLTNGPAQFDYWQHSPMHPTNNQSITFSAKIKDNSIRTVELLVLEFQLFTNTSGIPAKKRRVGGKWDIVKTWNFSGQNEADVNYVLSSGFPASSNVEYIFRVTNASGQRTDRLALFDAGTSPWPQDKILLYSTSRQPMQKVINLCFFPDVDFGRDWNLFKSDVKNLIYKGYHANEKIGSRKDKWAYYYTQNEMDGKTAAADVWNTALYPDFVTSNRIEGIDAFGLLHRQTYKDHALIKENINFVANTLFTSESYNLGTAVHETSHAVFKLSDEYDQCACFQTGDWSNVFQTLQLCQSFASEHSIPPSQCREVMSVGGQRWYTPEVNTFFKQPEECIGFNLDNNLPKDSCLTFIDFDGSKSYWAYLGTCIMHDDGDHNIRQFQSTCSVLIDEYYNRLDAGQIVTAPFSNNTILSENVDNIFGYEKVIAMNLTYERDVQNVEISAVKLGIPTKNIIGNNDIDLNMKNESGQTIYNLKLDNPSKILTEDGKESEMIRQNTKNQTFFNIPYNDDCARAIANDIEAIRTRPRSVGAPPDQYESNYDLKSQFENAKSKFHE